MPFFLRHGATLPRATPEAKAYANALALDPAWTSFLDALPAMTWLADCSGHLLYANQAWRDATALDPENFNPAQAEALVHPEDRERLGPASAPFSGQSTAFEFRLRHRDGTYRWTLERIRPWIDENYNTLGYIGSAIDIDDQKRHERRLSVIALRQTSLACFSQFILEQDDLAAVNVEALRLFCEHLDLPSALLFAAEPSSPARCVLSRGFPDELTPPELAATVPSSAVEFPADSARFPLPADWMRESGWHYGLAVPIDPKDPSLGCLIGLAPEPPAAYVPIHYARDLVALFAVARARERAARQLREGQTLALQLQKMEAVGLIAGGVAHDFNNLLTAIRCFAELLRDDLPDETQRGRADDILHATSRASHLVRQLLAFSRQEITLAEPIDLHALVDNLRGLIRSLLSEHIHLDYVFAPTPVWCHADPRQIEQVLFNLCLNARDVMLVEGRLTITVGPGPASPEGKPRVRLSIRDTGPGIPLEVRPRLFEPFFTTKARGRGTGLGLATSKSIARAYGGDLTFESTLGEGTVFHLDLPEIADPLAEETAEDSARADTPRQVRILLVEDDELVRTVTLMLAQSQGHQVTPYGDSVAALAWAADQGGLAEIDILITDVVMPGIGGHTLAEKLRALRPGLPVLYMSGYVDDPATLAALAQPDVVFLPKPFSHEQFTQRLHAAIELLPAQT